MFLWRVDELLGRELLKSTNYTEACISGFYNVVNVSIFCSIVRIAEELFVLFFLSSMKAARFQRLPLS